MSKVIKILFHLLSTLILVAITVPLLVSLLLQLPPVQNFVVDKATKIISKKLQTTISIDRVDLKLFNRVVIEKLYVEDYQKDTLIYADKLDVAIRTLGLGLRPGADEMRLGKVQLSGIKFYLMQRAPGESNLKQILNRLKSDKKKKKSSKTFILKAEELRVNDLHFMHRKLDAPYKEYGINFSDVDVTNLDLAAQNIKVVNDDISMEVNNISLNEKSGFTLEHLAARYFNISGKGIDFKELALTMPRNNLNFDYVRLNSGTWGGYSDFINAVRMEALLVDSNVAFSSIGYFAPSLRNWTTTIHNATMSLDGTVANMGGTVMNANSLDTKVSLKYSIKGIPDIENTVFKFNILDITTSANDVNQILTDITGKKFFETNKILDNLAKIALKGTFDGRISDFATKADISTNFGAIALDTKLRKATPTQTTINGAVNCYSFNAGQLLEVKNLGEVTLNTVVDGSFEGNGKMSLHSDGEIKSLYYNGYKYHDIVMNGVMSGKTFNGHLASDDRNLDFDFDGILDFSGKVPSYDFDLKLRNADLAKLNLNKRDSVSQLKCRIIADFNGTTLNNVNGRADIRDLEYINHIDTVRTGNITLTGQNSAESKYLALNSSFADVEFRSRMSYDTLLNYVQNTIDLYLPTLRQDTTRFVAAQHPSEIINVNDYSMLRMNVKQANNLSSIFFPGLQFAQGTQVSLMANPQAQQIALNAKSDFIEYNNFFVSGLNINSRNQGDSLMLYLGAEDVYVGGVYMPDLSIIGGAKQNTANISARFADTVRHSKVLLGVTAALDRNPQTHAPQVKINIKPSFMSSAKQKWRISARSIVYDTSQIVVNNFRISNDQQQLRINGIASKNIQDTISLSLSHFNLAPFSQFLDRMGYSLSGYTNGSASMASALKQGFLSAKINFDSVKLNDLQLPPAVFESKWDFSKERAMVVLARSDKPDTLLVGYYRPTDGRYRADAEINNVDISLLDPILSGVISNTKGTADLKVQLIGHKADMSFNGGITIPEFTTTVDFTNVAYKFTNGNIKITDSKLDLQPVKLYDPNGNSADFNMMLDLSSFANMKYSLQIKPENLMVLNTNSNQNDLFYGRIFASGLATIKGNKGGVNMDIAATTGQNSQFFLPLSGKSNASRANFIIFENPKLNIAPDSSDVLERRKMMYQRKQKIQAETNSTNININMAVNVLPNTELQVVIDPTVGDIIKARGNGSMNLHINPNNNVFAMYGDYEITEGSYLFTLQNIINKKFVIDPGSTIKWTGDPIDALLNITAIYKLKASLAPLDPSMTGTVPVDCEIMLSDRLSHPTVTFGVDIPNADPEVQSVVANLLNTQEMIATQFFWLLAVNSFSSDGSGGGGSNIGAAGGSATGFEFLSNQISNWISSDKFNIGIRYKPKSELTSEEVNIDFSTQLFSNRLLLEVEGNYDSGNNPTMANRDVNNLSGDFYLTWLIDKTGNLKAKVFSRTMDTFDENQGLQETGIGIYYKENFNTFKDIINNIRERFSPKEKEQRKDNREQKRDKRKDTSSATKEDDESEAK